MTNYKCKICSAPLAILEKAVFDDRHGYPGMFDIYHCGSCGFGQTLPEISEDEISDVYTRYYPRKNIDIEAMKKQPLNTMPPKQRWWMGVNNTAHYHITKGSKVLDIGCGDCTSIREINAMGAEGHGIEPDRNIKEIAEAFGLNVHVGLFGDLDFPEKNFDYITMSQVLEHIHDPARFLIDLKKILKQNGQIIIGVPSIDSRLCRKYRNRWLNWHVPYHINHFSRKSLELLAEQCGYRIKQHQTLTPNLWVELQERLYNYPVKEGVKVPFFNGESEPPTSDEKTAAPLGRAACLINKYKCRAAGFLSRFNVFKILTLRLCDALGQGESHLVFLEKK